MDRRLSNDKGRPIRLLVFSPWGLSGGYSGPIILQDRIMSSLINVGSWQITALYRDRMTGNLPSWVNHNVAIIQAPPAESQKAKQILWALRTIKYVLLHGSHYDGAFLQGAYLTTCLPALFLPRRSSLVVVPVVEGGDITHPPIRGTKRVKNVVQSLLFKRRILGVSLSTGIKSELLRRGVRESRAPIFYNFVDTRVYKPVKANLPSTPKVLKLLFVGSMGPRKQPHLILEMCNVLRLSGANVEVTFVGPFESTEYQHNFESQVARRGLRSFVHMTGMCADPLPYYQNADIFVLPSLSEGMPGALSEAMACGLPVIVSRAGAMSEVVKAAECGSVIDGFDIECWINAINRIWNEPSLYSSMSKSGHNFAKQHMSAEVLAVIIHDFVRRLT